MEISNFAVSLFADIRTKHPEDAVLSTVLSDIRSGKWESQITACRQAYASIEHAPDEKSAKARYSELKSKLPCFTLCQCLGGHARQNIRQYHGLVPLDFDHLPKEMLPKYQEIAAQCIHTLAVFLTPSGQGLRILVPTTCTDPEQHLKAWLAACSYYEQYILPGVKADKATKDPSRVSFVSFDPNATWHEAAEPMRVEMEETAKTEETDARSSADAMNAARLAKATNAVNVANSVKAANFVDTANFADATQKQQNQMPMAANKAEMAATPAPAAAEFDLQSTLEHYLSHHVYPAAGGGRNNFLFGLCLYCKSRTIGEGELEAELQHRFAEKDFTCQEISQVVHSAYSEKYHPVVSDVSNVSLKAPKIAKDKIAADYWDLEESTGEALREKTECLNIPKNRPLPSILMCILEPFTDARERDTLLLTSITSIGACLHRVTGTYARHKKWPTLYTLVIAPAGSGKGVMRWAEKCISAYSNKIFQESLKAHKNWEKLQQELEDRREIARRSKKKFEEVPPEEPLIKSILVPGILSRAKFIDHMMDNEPYSSLIMDSEADILSNSSRSECGQLDPLLRKISEHERISTSFKVDGKIKVIEMPHAGICLTGTTSQLSNFIESYENGLQSRILEYTFRREEEEWRDVSPSGDYPDLDEYYDKLSGEVEEIIEWINKKDRKITLSHSQWARLNDTFRKKLKEVELKSTDEEMAATVKRYGIIAFRVIMILTALRAWQDQNDSQVLECNEDDFENAMHIALTCLKHSCLLSTSLKKDTEAVNPLQNPLMMEELISLLPDEFSASDAEEVGRQLKLSRSTVNRYLRMGRDVDFDYIPHRGYRKKGASDTFDTSDTKGGNKGD